MRWLIGSLFGTKHNVLDKLLEAGMVMLHLDTRLDGVEVPPGHQGDSHLRLNVSYAFELDHFLLNDKGVEAKLKFGGQRHLCVLPWDAVFAMTSHVEPVGYLWPESLPPEFAHQLGNGEAAVPSRKGGAPALRVIDGSNNGEAVAAASAVNNPNDDSAAEHADNMQSVEDDGPGKDELPDAEPLAKEDHTEGSEDTETGDDNGDPDGGGRRYGHLRVVK